MIIVLSFFTQFSLRTRSYRERHSCFTSVRRTSRDRRKRWRTDAEWSEKASWRLVRWNGIALAPALIQFSILVSLYLFVYFCFSSSLTLSFFIKVILCILVTKTGSAILRNDLEILYICDLEKARLNWPEIQIFSWNSFVWSDSNDHNQMFLWKF